MQAVVEFGHSGLGAMCIDKSPAVFEDGGLQIVWWHLLSPVSSKQEIQDEKQIQTAGYRFNLECLVDSKKSRSNGYKLSP